MTDIFNTAAVKASGFDVDHPRAVVLSTRDDIMTMTQQAHDAALTPKNPADCPMANARRCPAAWRD